MIVAAFKSLKWTDFFLYSVTAPRELARTILSDDPKSFALSFSVPVIVSFLEIVSSSMLLGQGKFFFYKITYGWILSLILLCVSSVVAGCLMDFASQLSGAPGRAKKFISLINFSFFPKAFLLPFVYIASVLNFAPIFFYSFFSLLFFVWSAYVAVQGISEISGHTSARSTFIFAFPYLLAGMVICFSFILIAAMGIGFVSSLI